MANVYVCPNLCGTYLRIIRFRVTDKTVYAVAMCDKCLETFEMKDFDYKRITKREK